MVRNSLNRLQEGGREIKQVLTKDVMHFQPHMGTGGEGMHGIT